MPPLAATVTTLVFDVLPTVAVIVALPALPAVTLKFTLAFPGEMTALAPAVATDELEEANATVVLAVTAALIVAVRTCAFPGAKVIVAGVNHESTGVLGVPPPPPPPDVPPAAINKCPI